ncbi:MAG: SDR family NAD(P)-dependent oxidoreductase [Pseudomonadota bacterium]
MAESCMTRLFDLDGKLALVTGGARGLGLAIAEALAAHGATVVIADKDGVAAGQEAARLRQAGYRVWAVDCDLFQRAEIVRLASQVESDYGAIDILVCNAGIQGPSGPLGEVDEADWDRLMDINLRSMWRLTSHILPGMAWRGAVRAASSCCRASQACGATKTSVYMVCRRPPSGNWRAILPSNGDRRACA